MKPFLSMKPFLRRRRLGWTIRTRVLAIVLVPCLAMLALGVGTAGYLVREGSKARDWANSLQEIHSTGTELLSHIEEERRLSMLRLGGDQGSFASLEQQRRLVDDTLAKLEVSGALAQLNPGAAPGVNDAVDKLFAQLPAVRQGVDTRLNSLRDVYAFYNALTGIITIGLESVARTAPDPVTAAEDSTAADVINIFDAMTRSNALAAGAITSGGLSTEDWHEYLRQVSAYHAGMEHVLPRLTPQEQARYGLLLVADSAWQRLSTTENALIERGPKPAVGRDNRPLPMTVADWQNAANEVETTLLNIWSEHHRLASESAIASGNRTFANSLLGGGTVLVIALIAFLIAVRLSNTLVRRLERLRAETLQLADERLPLIVERLRAGEQIDAATAIPALDHGKDEIGQVANAFNKAQSAAVHAATQEAQIRNGMNAVFRNIAHRSQVVVRRQLEVLDEAESKQQDPTHLQLLFKLDHLATRSRRNAENLVILGGELPGRRWRNPVALEEIVRSAVSETEQFARVNTLQLPDVGIEGAAVADLIHLLAELVDNATAFSPPDSRVEVRGNAVGKGIVVEVDDQGLGIAEEERERLNAVLHNPPDFDVMALSTHIHLGLFVVGQLAVRHGIVVTLTDSAYGGIRAVVLLPLTLVASRSEPESTSRPSAPANAVEPTMSRSGARPAQNSMSASAPEPERNPVDGHLYIVGRLEDETASHRGSPRDPRPLGDDGANSADTVANGSDEDAGKATDTRAPLPRRKRQTHLAPQWAADDPSPAAAADQDQNPNRSPEFARDTMAAILRGTRQGRNDPRTPER
jgi:signal transduction histidine kinase